MATVTGFRTPEEAALDLELPLLGNLSAGPDVDGPVAAAWPTGEGIRRDVESICDRLFEAPLFAEGSIGVLGDVSASTRAAVSAALAAGIASERTTVLIDADLRAGHLSFDDRRRAQEGLVDVLRYGVRSPRVVSPTLTPGLALLPVGSRTLDLEGTYGAESVPGLFAELSRSGEVLLVNGPGPGDLDAAEPLLAHVEGWILVHEIGASDPEKTRSLRDRCGRSRCVGVLVLTPAGSAARAGAVTEDEVEAEAAPVVAPAPPAPSPEPMAAPAAAGEETPRAEPPEEPRTGPPAPAPVAWEPAAEHAPTGPSESRSRSRTPWVLGGAAVAAIVLAVMFWPRPGGPPEAPPAMTAPPAEPTLEPGTAAVAPAPEDAAAVVPPPDATDGAETPAAGESAGAESGPGTAAPVVEPSRPVVADTPPAQDRVPAPADVPPAGDRAPAATSSPATSPAPPAGGMVFGVHLESVKSEEGAAKEAAALTAQGTPAFIHRTDIPDKGTWWRVYAGPFATRDEAEQAAARIRAGGREYTQVHRLERGDTGR